MHRFEVYNTGQAKLMPPFVGYNKTRLLVAVVPQKTILAFGYMIHIPMTIFRSGMIRRIFDSFQTLSYGVEIWSLARGSWRGLSTEVVAGSCKSPLFASYNPSYIRPPTLVNSALHWVQVLRTNGKYFILSLDFPSELFGEVIIPEVLRGGNYKIKLQDTRSLLPF